eukprot:356334-Pleurochrysis_carterae.AAC.1
MEIMIYIGLRAILDDVFNVVVSATESGTSSLGTNCRHSPNDKWDNTSHSQNTESSANQGHA